MITFTPQTKTTRPVGRLETLRRERGLTQGQMATAAQLSRTTIVSAEGGRLPGPYARRRIAGALGVPETVIWPGLASVN